MFGRVAIFASAIALSLAAVPAKAVTIAPDPDTTNHNLVVGQTYEYSDIFLGGSQIDLSFTFTLTPPLATTSSFTVLNLLPGTIPAQEGYGISNLYAQWDGSAAVQLTEADGDVILANVAILHGLLTSPTTLHLFTQDGGVLTRGGQLDFQITVAECAEGPQCVPGETPLPGAVALFGSVLAGGVGGMQIMRRRRRAA